MTTYPWGDASSSTFGAEAAYEWDEERYCNACQRDVLLGMELLAGRVWGTCDGCWSRVDFTPPEDDDDEPGRLPDGSWPCQLGPCGCAGLIDCDGPGRRLGFRSSDEPDEAGAWSTPQTVPYYRTQRVGRRR